MSKILIRVQSPDGVKRIESHNDSTHTLYNKVLKEFDIEPSSNAWSLYLDRNRAKLLPRANSKSVSSILKHGDLIYLLREAAAQSDAMEGVQKSGEQPAPATVELDEVDRILSKTDGRVIRKRDEQLCHHGANSQCIHCVPVEPYDQTYLMNHDPPIKYMSYHAYLRKLSSGVDKGKYLSLEHLDCKIKSGCKEHPPWPKGICNKCQPNTIYLNRQNYRHVDNILFENPQIVERFLNFWRKSGHQRMGFLYGRYEVHEGVPLGIRVSVAAIYEPPQETSHDDIKLLPDANEAKVNFVAKKLGLVIVGWIFTDLVTEDPRKGTVKHFRGNADTHFLSAEECIMAAHFQNIHKNSCQFAAERYFGSKFVTVVVTGDSTNQIHFEGYQVSNQCMDLVTDNCMIPTHDAPELAYIKETTPEQFVPDVYYRDKDQYKNEVTKVARPLPVEFLLIDIPLAFPKESIYRFKDHLPCVKTQFPVENRSVIGEIQDFHNMPEYLEQFSNNAFLERVSDFHFLLFLATNGTVSFEDNSMEQILEAVVENKPQKALSWSLSPEWQTLEHIIHADNLQEAEWACRMCTYMNPTSASMCQICRTERN